MIKRILIYLLISLSFGLLFFYMSQNLFFSIGILGIYLVYCIYFEYKFNKYSKLKNRTKECINFINNFIITLSVNNSIEVSFNSLKEGFSKDLKDQIESINNLNNEEIIHYLDNYFTIPLYTLFLKLFDQYIYNGGNLLDNSNTLIFDSRLIENNLDNHISISKSKLFEFLIMWGLCFLIIALMQIFLGDYFVQIRMMDYFPIALTIFFLSFLISFSLIINHLFNIDFIKGDLK